METGTGQAAEAIVNWNGARRAELCVSNGAAGGDIGAAVAAYVDGRVAAADAAVRERNDARMTATAMKVSVDASANYWLRYHSDVAETDTGQNFLVGIVQEFLGKC